MFDGWRIEILNECWRWKQELNFLLPSFSYPNSENQIPQLVQDDEKTLLLEEKRNQKRTSKRKRERKKTEEESKDSKKVGERTELQGWNQRASSFRVFLTEKMKRRRSTRIYSRETVINIEGSDGGENSERRGETKRWEGNVTKKSVELGFIYWWKASEQRCRWKIGIELAPFTLSLKIREAQWVNRRQELVRLNDWIW